MDETEILPANVAAHHQSPVAANFPYAEEIDRLGDEIKDLYERMNFGCFSVGADGVCTEINDIALGWLGRDRAEVVGRQTLQDWLTPESWENFRRHEAIFNGVATDALELDLLSSAGVIRPVSVTTRTLANVPGQGVIRRSVLFDLTEHKKTDRRRAIEMLAFEAMAGICITDHAGNILHFNKSFLKLTGYAREELKGNLVAFVEAHGLDKSVFEFICRDLEARGKWEGEVRTRHKDKSPLIVWLSITALSENDSGPLYYVANIYDITSSKTIFDEVSRLASFDSLTQLPNRRALQERVARELPIAARSGLRGALLFLDLDNFKSLNDTRGHAAGDSLLIETGQRLRSAVRKEDIVARMGGDEFVALLTDLSSNPKRAAYQAKTIGEKILAALAKHYQFSDFEFSCPASMGIALFSGDETVDELLQHADVAMYEAKKSGRGSLRFFDEEMQVAAKSHTFLEQELSRITLGDQLALYYQPQVNADGQIEAAEGLLRWRHPSLGLVSPEDFIPVAEESALILPIGQWVLETACAQIKAWENNSFNHKIRLSVNVSARQFALPDFEETVRKAIDDARIDPRMLMLELTESMMHNAVDTAAKMNRLKEIGVSFSLDDFGTGYSSLSVLTQLPLAQLKIAQSFVSDLTIKKAAASVIETIIGMGRSLDLSVVAEGVQTEAQRTFLQSKGCTHFQGYLFSRPLPIDAFDEFVSTNKGRIEKRMA